jgi:hypothetical protein
MSLYKDASLVMIPSAVKDGKLYSIRPTDGSGDFTFSRGSNLAATRVDVNGLIEKGRENRLLQSNQFDTTWSIGNYTSIVSGQSGYDGTNNAWLWTAANGTFTNINQTNLIGGGVATLSVYVKAGNTHFVALQPYGSGSAYIKFNLSTGAVHETFGSPIDYGIEAVSGGWYRCYVTDNYTNSQTSIYLLDAAGNFANTSTDSIYIQAAQLESSLVATDYIETGASTAQAGILEDLPRLDYSGGASCPSLLLEPLRTNFIPHSEYINDASWGKSAVGATLNVTSNYGISPDGSKNATRIEASLSGGYADIVQVLGTSSGTAYTYSVYLKSLSGTPTIYFIYDGTANRLITLTTEWKKYTFEIPSAPTIVYPRFLLENGFTSSSADFLAWGAQLEQGSYPTSYIPTYGSAVTRSYDVCKKTNIDSLIAEEGTAFIDVTNGDENEVNAFMTIADSSVYPDHIWIGQNGTTLSLYVKANDSYSLIANNIVSIEGRKKIAVVYTNESIKVFVNGTNEYTTLNKTLPSQLNRVELNAFNTSINTGTARYDQAILFPTALTDSECIALTTL